MKKTVIFANWKMNKKLKEAEQFICKLVGLFGQRDDLVLIMCVPYPYIGFLAPLCERTCIGIGSENMFYEEWGAFTGEVSAPMLASVGCSYVLIGHSERRKYFYENDEDVNRKMLLALEHGLIPLVCIGETIEERDSGRTFDILERQVITCFRDISQEHRCYVAYEPRWAIGSGIIPEYEAIEKSHIFIREKIIEHHGTDVVQNVGVLYGGSVDPDNSFRICSLKGVDGLGFGGCSLDFECFVKGIEESVRAMVKG